MTERSTGGDGAPDQVIEITIDPELAADETVRAALEHLSQQLAEAELLDDDEVVGFSLSDRRSISLDKSNTSGPTTTNAGCIGFSMGDPSEGPWTCTIHWTSCITKGIFG